MVAIAPDAKSFARGRDFAAWLGLTPRQHSTGGKQRLGRTSKMGDQFEAAAHHRRQRGAQVGCAPERAGWPVAEAHHGDQAAAGGARCAGQQDGAHSLGAHGQRRNLSGSGCGGIDRRQPRGCRWRRKGKGRISRNSRRDRTGKTSTHQSAPNTRRDLDPVPVLPYGPAACKWPHQRPDT